MKDLVSYVCVRADHQWATGAAGQVQPKDGALAWCPDASLDAHEAHEWRACEAAPISDAGGVASRLGMVESAAYL